MELLGSKNGQSQTVQGELLRAIEKLRDECSRNGNCNWDEGHEILACYIRDTLNGFSDVQEEAKEQLRIDIDRILDYENPYMEDDLFDRVQKVILDWCALNKKPIHRKINPKLHR